MHLCVSVCLREQQRHAQVKGEKGNKVGVGRVKTAGEAGETVMNSERKGKGTRG